MLKLTRSYIPTLFFSIAMTAFSTSPAFGEEPKATVQTSLNTTASHQEAVTNIDEATQNRLCTAAQKAAENAYAPYSHFRVGAAILMQDGQIFTGTNVENASYGLALCAERSALVKMISSTAARKIKAVAVACIDAPNKGPVDLLMPCGACRQWLFELAPDAIVFIAGRPESFMVKDLLPHAFSLHYSNEPEKN